MILPELQDPGSNREQVTTFAGYNHQLKNSDTIRSNNKTINVLDWYDEQNISSDLYPIFSTRKKRGTKVITKPLLNYLDKYITGFTYNNGWIATMSNGHILVTQENRLTSTDIDLGLSAGGQKRLINMGAYICIFPDKKYINTADLSDRGSLDATFEFTATDSHRLGFSICMEDAEQRAIDDTTIKARAEAPTENLVPGETCYIDNSVDPPVIKMWSKNNVGGSALEDGEEDDGEGTWEDLGAPYLKIKAKNIAKNFKKYDGVHISGIQISQTQGNYKDLEKLNDADYVLYQCYHDPGDTTTGRAEGTNDFVAISAGYNYVTAQKTGTFKMTRKAPDMDYVIECNNRLWGCRYHRETDGTITNSLYCSKAGDAKNWSCIMNVATDSWSVPVGSSGRWTGAISYQGHPIFFKEDRLYKIYGDYPSAYSTSETVCDGVQLGAGRSLDVVDSYLYYKARRGVMRYDGNMPYLISEALGDDRFLRADPLQDLTEPEDLEQEAGDKVDYYWAGPSAGHYCGKYYISMRGDDGWRIFVYDTSTGIWHVEDATRALQFISRSDDLYFTEDYVFTTEAGQKKDLVRVRSVNGSGTKDTEPVEWYAETQAMGTGDPDHKYISRIDIRLAMEQGSRLFLYIQYDSFGDWEHISTLTGNNLRAFSLPVRVRRCDHFRLRLQGSGDVKIYSMTRTVERGSDL